jgi:endonuclease/exonuclease/phosphatase family metal-dependent hydrolase
MRNLSVFLLTLFFGTSSLASDFEMASWNIRNISNNSRSDAELGIISLVIFRYDFVAVQEVLDETVIERIKDILKDDFQADYDILVSDQVGGNKKERYAFIWRTNKIRAKKDPWFYGDPGNRFEREPYCGSFELTDDSFDWTVCTIHLLFGDNEAHRRPELKELDNVYRSVKPDDDDVFICGDFNFPPNDVGWDQLKNEDGMMWAIDAPTKTTIKDVSLYDNCWWSEDTPEVVEDSGQVYEFDELMYPEGSRKEANRLTSDHRPISISIEIE